MALFPHTAEAHCVSVLPFRPANMLNKVLRFASSVSVLGLLFAQLGGCSSNEGSACGSNAECLTGQVCSSGSCVAPGAAGAAGSPSGSAGAMSSGGNGTPQGGAANVGTAGSSVGMAGSVSNGGSPSSGGQSQGGAQSNAGSSSGGSSSGGSGTAGSGGSAGSGTVVGQCKDDFWPAANNGSVTRYDFNQGTSLPACTYVITHTGNGNDGDWDTVEGISTGDGGYFGAMNTEDYALGAACGACVEASYQGKKVVLTIVDECPLKGPKPNPKCTKGHIDLSRKAIRQLQPNGSLEDLNGVSWHYVKCPANGNVKARLHPNQNPNWQPIVIENGLYPLKSVTLNGVNATRAGNDAGGNAWIATGQKTPYTVRATDVNDNTITFSYGDTGLKDVGQQFMCK
jgi:expansin (peptidoglycan-binding protein)